MPTLKQLLKDIELEAYETTQGDGYHERRKLPRAEIIARIEIWINGQKPTTPEKTTSCTKPRACGLKPKTKT